MTEMKKEEKKEEKAKPEQHKAQAEPKAETKPEKVEPKAETKPEKVEPKAETKPEKAAAKKPSPELSKKLKDLMKSVEEMTVMELSTLVKAMEDKFGVSASMPMMAMAPGGAGGAGAGAAAEEKTTFDVILAKMGDKKIQVIKEIRTVTSLGLKEAKDLVESAPKPIKQGVSKEEAAEIKKKVEAQGATVELK